MRIVVLTTKANTACGWWRVDRPLEALKKYGVESEIVQIAGNGKFDTNLDGAIVVLQRLALKEPDKFINSLRSMGAYRVVFELDDDIISNAYNTFILGCGRVKPSNLGAIDVLRAQHQAALDLCDAVTVSTENLKGIVQSFTRTPCYVSPNGIDLEWFEKRLVKRETNDDIVRIGWAGGLRPQTDLKLMAEAWATVEKLYSNVRFVVAGWQPDIIYELVDMDRIDRVAWKSLEEWPQCYRFDIGCAALDYSGFNYSRSPIKYFEYSVAKCATVATPVIYNDVILDGLSGFIAFNLSDWIKYLSTLIENKGRREFIAESAYLTIKNEFTLDKVIDRWYKNFEGISK